MDTLGRLWLNERPLAAEAAQELQDALERLSRMYARHITVEDQELFPLAARLLPADELADVGREMASRRGVAKP